MFTCMVQWIKEKIVYRLWKTKRNLCVSVERYTINKTYKHTHTHAHFCIGSVASNLQHCKASDVLKRYNSYPIPDKPRLLILAGKTMFVGFKEQYLLIHLETSHKQKIFGTGKKSRDAIGVRLINKEVLLVVDKKGYFVNYEAKPTRSKCVEFGDIPLCVTYFHPFIVSVQSKCIELHHFGSANLVQSIDFKNGKYAASVCYKSASIWTSFLCISSSFDVVSLSQSLISEQLKYLKEHFYFEEALQSIDLFEALQFEQDGLDKDVKRRYINEYFGYFLFNESQWKSACDTFIASEVSTRRIISLFPTLVPPGQCKKARTKHPIDYQNVKKSDSTFKQSINLFLIPYLQSIKQHRLENINYAQFDCSDEFDDKSEWKLSELIDTVYCKCLIETQNVSKLRLFLKNDDNECNVEECELLLKQTKHFEELVLLYESHNEHRAALDLMRVKNAQINGLNKTVKYLQKLGKFQKNEKLILHFSEWVFRQDADEALRIFTGKTFDEKYENVKIQNLPKIDPNQVTYHLERIKAPIPTRIAYLEMLIFEAHKTESIFHDDLIRLYLTEIHNASREQEREDEISREKYGLARGDIVELTHPFSLGIKGWVKKGTKASVYKVTPTPNHSIQVLVTFPETGTRGVVPKVQLKKVDEKKRVRPEKIEGRVGDLRRKLIKFLKESQYFIPTNIKNLFPRNTLLEEQAWLRAKIPQHREALDIVIYELNDPEMAEEYAHEVYRQYHLELEQIKKSLIVSSKSKSKKIDAKIMNLAKNKLFSEPKWIEAEKIYLTLLDVYLHPPNKYKLRANKLLRHALKMLGNNHERVDAIAVFNKLPTDILVSECASYMEAVFKRCFEKKREFQVKKNLLKQASLRLTLRKHRREESFQRITEYTKCSKCDKRIGSAAFVRFPNQNVFHYVCVRSNQFNQQYQTLSNRKGKYSINRPTIVNNGHAGTNPFDSMTYDID